MSGWIKLHRSLLDWEWYDDINATRLLVHLLVSVNHEEKNWKGIKVLPGQLIYSWENLSLSTGLTVQQLRTAMKRLESSGEINRQVTAKYQLVTLVKWEKLQDNNSQLTANPTNKQQASNSKTTTTKEYKKIRSKEILIDKSINIDKSKSFDERRNQFRESLREFEAEFTTKMVEDFFLYWGEKTIDGKKMRFEIQKTFEPKLRLTRWRNNNFEKQKNQNGSGKKSVDDAIREFFSE